MKVNYAENERIIIVQTQTWFGYFGFALQTVIKKIRIAEIFTSQVQMGKQKLGK